MDELREWTLALCCCAVVVSLAETLLPEGSVKKTAYVVLSLITVSCIAAPLKNIGSLDLFGTSEVLNDSGDFSDWLSRMTEQEFSSNVESLIADTLAEIGVEAKNISVATSITDDGSVYINKARITVDLRYQPRLDEIEELMMNRLGIEADVAVR